MHWFGSDIWVTWIAVGVVCLAIELFSGALIFLMLGLAGFSAALADLAGGPVSAQIAVFGSMSVALLWFVRPRITSRIHHGPTIAVGARRLIGQCALVVEPIDDNGGQVRIGDQLWAARSVEAGQAFFAGDEVLVTDIDKATALVAGKETD